MRHTSWRSELKIATDEATLLDASTLFGPLHKLKLQYGNRGATVCDLFTAGGFLDRKSVV